MTSSVRRSTRSLSSSSLLAKVAAASSAEIFAVPAPSKRAKTEGPSRVWSKRCQQQWEGIVAMREHRDADVDYFGAEALSQSHPDPKVMRYHALISVMLSSQTRDPITARTMKRLQEMDGGLTIETVNAMDEDALKLLIKEVGFYNRKAKYIKETTRILADKYDSDVPNNLAAVCSLPGCGQKMAKIALRIGWGNVCGISVDTHVHRVSRRLGWTTPKATTPEKSAMELEEIVPNGLWDQLNLMVVGFGQQICRAKDPLCDLCLIKDICPKNGVRRR